MRTKMILSFALLVILGLAAAPGLQAQDMPPRGDDADRPRKNGRTEATIDGVDIIVTYGRPQVKGRTVWGGLVGYGQVWRAGANEATVISFSKDLTINGEALPAGVYGFFVIPQEGEWTLIFNNQAKQWGHFSYDATHDALRVKATPVAGENVEELDYVVEGNQVLLRWEKLKAGFTIAPAE